MSRDAGRSRPCAAVRRRPPRPAGVVPALLLALLASGCAVLGGGNPAAPPDDSAAQANFKLGIGYLQTGQYNQSEIKLRRALEFDPAMAEAHNALGVLYEQIGNGREAEKQYRLAVDKDPDYTLAQMNFARVLCSNGKGLEGERQFLAVAHSGNYEALEIPFTGAGVCARIRSDPAAADNYFRQALEHNPNAAGTLLELASLGVELKRYAEARELLERYHRQAGFSPVSLNLAIQIEDQLGDTRRGDEYRRLLKQQSNG